MQKYYGRIETKFWWIIPILIGVSKSNVDNKATVYALHITPLFEIGFNWKKKQINEDPFEAVGGYEGLPH
jgi:hypothetical protein